MKIYLIQHGEARSKEEDKNRPLTDKGKVDIKKLRDLLSKNIPDKIYHSEKLRAEETAKILAQGKTCLKTAGLAPNDPIEPFVKEINNAKEDIMLVGHLPYLSKLASFLLNGDQEKQTVAFKQGSVLCLEKVSNNWTVAYMIVPELI